MYEKRFQKIFIGGYETGNRRFNQIDKDDASRRSNRDNARLGG